MLSVDSCSKEKVVPRLAGASIVVGQIVVVTVNSELVNVAPPTKVLRTLNFRVVGLSKADEYMAEQGWEQPD